MGPLLSFVDAPQRRVGSIREHRQRAVQAAGVEDVGEQVDGRPYVHGGVVADQEHVVEGEVGVQRIEVRHDRRGGDERGAEHGAAP